MNRGVRHPLVIRDRAIDLHEQGKTVMEIVAALKEVPEGTVRGWITWANEPHTYPNGYPVREIDRRCRELGERHRAAGLGGVDPTLTVRYLDQEAA